MSEINRKIAVMRGYTVEKIDGVFVLRHEGSFVECSRHETDAWFQAPDYENELDAAYPLFLDLLASHCDPALVAGWEPDTVECNTVEPNLSNAAPKDQPALAIALTWVEWKESLNG